MPLSGKENDLKSFTEAGQHNPSRGGAHGSPQSLKRILDSGVLSALAAGILAALPIWLTTFPPMVDLPQYAAQVSMFKRIVAGNWAFAHLFDVELFTPYLTAFFLIWMIEPVTGMVTAVKVVVSLALFGMPVSTALLVREFRGDSRWSWLVVPTSYSFAFNWGFLNFLVAAPLGMIFLIAAHRYARAPSLRFGLVMALLTHLLFFSHVLPLFFFGALAGLLILMRARTVLSAFIALLPLLSLAPVGLGWGLPSLGGTQVQTPMIWDLRWSRVLDIPALALGTESSVSYRLLFVGVIVIPLLGGARPSRDLERYAPLALCLLVLLFVPNVVAGTFFTYHRFALLAVPLYLLVLDRGPLFVQSQNRKIAEIGAVAVAVAWVGQTIVRFQGYERESADFHAITNQMEPDRRVLSMVFERRSRYSGSPIYLHYPVWYQAENKGLVDFNFAGFQGYPVHYRSQDVPAADDRFVWQPYTFNWPDHRKLGYRYLLARVDPGAGNGPLRIDPCDDYILVANSGVWWLYEVDIHRIRPEACIGPGS